MPPRKDFFGGWVGWVGIKSRSSNFPCLQAAQILGEGQRPINKYMDAGKVEFSITAASLIERSLRILNQQIKGHAFLSACVIYPKTHFKFSNFYLVKTHFSIFPKPTNF